MAVKIISVFPTYDKTGRHNIVIKYDPVVPGVPAILKFRIYRSFSPDKGFIPVGESATSFFLDTNVSIDAPYVVYYKVTYITEKGESSLKNAASACVSSLKLLEREKGIPRVLYNLSRQEMKRINWYLENFGSPAKLLIRKWAGQPCRYCYDVDGSRITSESCLNCFGTGYEGGYVTFSTRVIKGFPLRERLEFTESGILKTTEIRNDVYVPAFPPVRRYDILVMQDNNRFIVSEINTYQIQDCDVYQYLTLDRVDMSHPVYFVPC